MRNIKFYVSIDGVSTRIWVRKVPLKRMFIIKWDEKGINKETTIAVNDTTNLHEYYEGTVMTDVLFSQVIAILKQYFDKVKAILPIDGDSYDDYDDD